MRYEGNIYRPGSSESNSYLLQVTMGCSHNQCTFCSFFKDKPFKVRPYKEVEEDIIEARKYYPHVPGIFLIDGNVTCLSMDRLKPILKKLKEVFPESTHTNMYGSFRDINRKSVDELREMKELGVQHIYIGLESGSDKVLSGIKKGYTAEQAIMAGKRMNEAGIGFGTSLILGIGGVENSEDHIQGTIKVLNEINSAGIALMTVNPQSGTELFSRIMDGTFELPTYRQIFKEEKEILEGFIPKRSCSVYTGGFLPGNQVIVGRFPKDKQSILRQVEQRETALKYLCDKKIQINGWL